MAAVQLTAVFTSLGFSSAAAAVWTHQDKENVQIEALKYFDDKGVQILCATLRKQGGILDKQVQGCGAAACTITNPGVYVSTRAEINLKSACYLAMHHQGTSRTLEQLT
jgi:hypothetical protein